MFEFAPPPYVPATMQTLGRRWAVLLCWAVLIAVFSLVTFGSPCWAHAQTAGAPPSGVRRSAPGATPSEASSKVVTRRTISDPTFDNGSDPRLDDASFSEEVDEYSMAARDEAIDYADVEPDAWHTSYVDPMEPSGFSGERMTPAQPDGVGPNSEYFEQEYMPFHEQMEFDAPAPAVSSGEWLRNAFWYTEQSVVYLDRSAGIRNSIILGVDLQATILPHDFPTLDIRPGMGFEPGIRSMWGRRIGRDDRNRDHSIEFTFLGLTHWQAAGGLQSDTGNGIFTPIDPTILVPTYNASSQQTYDLTSDFNSWELNYRITRRRARDRMIYTRDSTWVRQATPALLPSLYAGLRVASINERLAWLAESNLPESTGSYLVQTYNTLVGPQLGFDIFYERSNWRAGVRIKGAAMVNWAAQSSQVSILDSNGTPLVPNRDESANVHDAGFLGEVGFVGAYHIRPNIALRASYDLMWATNLALAQNQLTFNPAPADEIAKENTLFFQGLGFGFEITW
jgi:hypothetical protein